MKTLAELVADPANYEEEVNIFRMVFWRYPEIAAVVYVDARRRGEVEMLPNLEEIVAQCDKEKPYYNNKRRK